MDKNSIRKYAVWARRELIERVSQRAMIYGSWRSMAICLHMSEFLQMTRANSNRRF